MHVQERASPPTADSFKRNFLEPSFSLVPTNSPALRRRHVLAIAIYAQSPCTSNRHVRAVAIHLVATLNPRSQQIAIFPVPLFQLFPNKRQQHLQTHTHSLSLSLSLTHTHTFASLTLTRFFLSQSTQVIFTFFFICLRYPSPCVIVFCCCCCWYVDRYKAGFQLLEVAYIYTHAYIFLLILQNISFMFGEAFEY